MVYAAKSLLRGESPRDFVDIIRSMKHRPNIVIADVANKIATCGNRISHGMFRPHEGRLTDNTSENIAAAKEGTMELRLPFLDSSNSLFPSQTTDDRHPISGSDQYLALFDWFHEGNCKDPAETLRNISLVKGLAGYVDTQAAEQLFNSLKRDLYFINQMSPVVHLFIFRLLLHFHNDETKNY